MSAHVDVLSPGLMTTVQDLGRWGHQTSGVPVSGAMDPFSHRLANALAGNGRHAATLEVTIVGPTLRFLDARWVAVAGAAFDLFLDERPIAMGRRVSVGPGAVLQFGARHSGARAYVAVSGGFDAPVLLGSRATHVTAGIGGWQGRAIRRTDRLPLGMRSRTAPRVLWDDAGSEEPELRPTVAPDAVARTESPRVVRVTAGPQDDRFAPEALESLVSAPYHVGVDSDRVGFRLTGPGLAHRSGADIISDATPLGSVQVPASGQPVLLMADRQTTGGYPKLATVITADIGVAGQLAPGDQLLFRLCNRKDALDALHERERPIRAAERAVE